MRGAGASGARGGFTLIELVVAMGLVSIVMLAVFQLLDTATGLWTRGETQRSLVEASSATAELLVADLRSLHPGVQGDLLAEWESFDADGDGIRERYWPRVRLVRHVSPATVARLLARDGQAAPPAGPAAGSSGGSAGEPGQDADSGEAGDATRGARTLRMPGSRLIEVVWCIVPAQARAATADGRAEGLLLRGERLLDDPLRGSFFAPGFFDGAGMPRAADVDPVTGGLLYCGLAFASQTTLFEDGWRVGGELTDASASWDAWQTGRPDVELHEWNEAAAGAPPPRDAPVLPRRVRLELEFERAVDLRRRPRLAEPLDATETSFQVTRGDDLPGPGSHLLLDAEWMEVTGVREERVSVKRGVRGTAAVPHASGSLVHHGHTVVFEVPIAVHRDDWSYTR